MTDLPAISEKEFQQQVLALAKHTGWLRAHFRPARVLRHGVEVYETPVDADGKGFPDCVLVHRKRGLIICELKSATGKLTLEQRKWLSAFEACGIRTFVWRPSMWKEIEEVLMGTE